MVQPQTLGLGLFIIVAIAIIYVSIERESGKSKLKKLHPANGKKVNFSVVDDTNYGNPDISNYNMNKLPNVINTPINGDDYAQQNQTSPDYELNDVAKYQKMKQHQAANQGNLMDQYDNAFQPYNPNKPGASPYSQNFPDMGVNSPRGCKDTSAAGYELNVDSLMPASWQSKAATSEETDNSNWTKFAPSKQSFNRYITAGGSARLAMNTRSALHRNIGTPLLLRSGTRTPISTDQVIFNDSGYRQDSVFNSTGVYPQNTSC